MKDDQVIDYALPLIDAEKAIKKANDALLAKRYDDALDALLKAVVELRSAYVATRFIKEQDHALRQQIPPVQEGV